MRTSGRILRLEGPIRAGLVAALLAILAATPGSGYTLIRTTGFSQPGAHWPLASLPLPMRISSAGSDDVPDNSDTNAIIAAQGTWNQINTDYFAFATPSVGTGTALNSSDGINSIFFDEAGTYFPAGTTAIAFTNLNINGTTGEISDADLVFNGRDMTFSTATPTPAGDFDIQSIATHELGHVTGLDHASIVSAVMFPVGADGEQFQRNLSSDDRLGDSFLYPESAAGTGIAGLQAGDGDLALTTGTLSGSVQTSGGVAVPGAAVVALDPNGQAVVSDLSGIDGAYRLTGLAPGNYQVYAEPLDGVTVEQDLSQSDFMNAFIPFVTTFLGGNTTPATVAVTAGADSPGNVVNLGPLYGVETEANNTFTAANPVALEALTSGVSNPAGDVDYFSFPGSTGDFINIDVDASGDGLPFDPYVTLYSTNGTTILAVNDDFKGKGNDSRIVRQLPAVGNFYVRVEDYSNTTGGTPVGGPGSFYTLHVNKAIAETESNNTAGMANAAVLGQYRGGIISSSSDVDYYAFTLGFGTHLLAEISANRAGSPLDPALTLYSSNGTTQIAINTDIDLAGGNKDALIDYTCVSLCASGPVTVYLKVSAQSGAGSTAFYVLHLGTDFLNPVYSGTNTYGQGLNGTTWVADIFPKFIPQGSSFDLIVAGKGMPFDPNLALSVSGPGVTLVKSAGSDIGTNANGIDFFAMSTTVSGSAPPGARTIFARTSTRQAAESGTFVITPSAVPPEEGAVSAPLAWSGGQMAWGADPSASFYNVYRGSLPLVDADLNGLADSYGSPFACGLTSPLAADPDVPALGGGTFYLVTGRNANGEGTLGFTRNNAGTGPERPKSALTATCP